MNELSHLLKFAKVVWNNDYVHFRQAIWIRARQVA